METCPVELWTISLAREYPNHLSEDEMARADRFRFEKDRARWVRARSALRMILSRYANDDPGNLIFTYGPQGKPSLKFSRVPFNLSHAGDWAMIAVTRSASVGVDIESIRPNVDMAALLRRLGETDLAGTLPELFRVWTRREARSKAAGGTLWDKPADDVRAIDIAAPEGYAASVALVGYEPVPQYRTLT